MKVRRFLNSFQHSEKGFTLIELLVVVAILGITAAVAVPNLGKFIGHGETEAMQTELHNVQLAMSAGMFDNNLSTVSQQ
jgi:type IV pilus assembly protein PilA